MHDLFLLKLVVQPHKILAFFTGSRQESMLTANEDFVNERLNDKRLDNNSFQLVNMTRSNNYSFNAIFFKIDKSLVLSFVGSLVSFSVLFVQLEMSQKSNIKVEQHNVTSS